MRAGLAGVLQLVPVEVGQQVTPGTNLARVARPDHLKAVIRVPETLARDVVPGQKAVVDTRNGGSRARVVRVDPAVQKGTVTVDLTLVGELPLRRAARPDGGRDGRARAPERRAARRASGDGPAPEHGGPVPAREGPNEATRVRVRLGQASVSTIEVVEGLEVGDEVILSDTSAWDSADRIRLN